MDQGECTIPSEVKSGPPDHLYLIRGPFCCRVGSLFQLTKELKMDKKELTYAKQSIVNVKDWDAFQTTIRFLAFLLRRGRKATVA